MPKRQIKIKTPEALRKAIIRGTTEFKMLLNGGAYSAKTITLARDGRFRVLNHIDGTKQLLLDAQLNTHSNIGKWMSGGAFVTNEK